jgi:BolA-like protein 3
MLRRALGSSSSRRFFSDGAGAAREARIRASLLKSLQANEATLDVEDLSGGCDGGTVRITVESPLFRGKNVVQQHRMVNETIADEMKNLHAAMIKTIKPKD